MSSLSIGALPYTSPSITTLLLLSSFLLLLNIFNSVLNSLVSSGLVAQILLGTAYGAPGANWLTPGFHRAVLDLGYLGLVLLVYQGGLSTNLKALKANLPLSLTVAGVGISTPIALSFCLRPLLRTPITNLQAFAAGAALCSTSLGTTFTVLSTAGLTESRLGVVLSSAAMMDDVAGLVMVQVIMDLGRGGVDAGSVVRPVLVAVGFVVAIVGACRGVVGPLTRRFCKPRKGGEGVEKGNLGLETLVSLQGRMFLIQSAVLIAVVAAASYAGTSDLFAAYLAGAAVSWWSDLRSNLVNSEPSMHGDQADREPNDAVGNAGASTVPTTSITDQPADEEQTTPVQSEDATELRHSVSPANVERATRTQEVAATQASAHQTLDDDSSGLTIYNRYYNQPVECLLKPMFFASIGFSIPISRMFAGPVIWRGLVYATLMAFGKLVCGLCLVRFNLPVSRWRRGVVASLRKNTTALGRKFLPSRCVRKKVKEGMEGNQSNSARSTGEVGCILTQPATPPLSLYPSFILGSAMVARGEIGFLISSIAEAQGVFQGTQKRGNAHDQATQSATSSSSELFLVVNWAILLCTILGPLTVGLLVKRVRRLQEAERRMKTGKQDPFGIWGVFESQP